MNRTTILTVVIALASLGGAVAMRPKPVPQVTYEDTGELLFPNFTDPSQAASLEVIGWDDSAARTTNFKVELKDGRWTIPSHNDYPADGTERMGKAAASFIDVRKDIYRGDRPEDHAKYGVEDPTDINAKERGQRITIKDASGTVLADVIVGKRVEDKEGYRYIRLPDQKRVYAVKIEVDISTNFTDWIEKDLLKLEQDQVVQFISDAYKVDEARGKVVGSDPFVAKKDATDDNVWLLDEKVSAPAGKELDSFKVKQAIGALDRLQIVGVRPRPELLTLSALQSKGFFVTPDGSRLYGNEGEVRAICDDGVVYTLYFGEVTYDSGLALTAGTEEAPKPEGEEEEAKKDGTANRYMFVDVDYDPTLDTKSSADNPEDAPGAKRAQQLAARFNKWFYVISDASFKQIRKPKADFFKDAPAEKKDDKKKAG
ncbi:MAG TPA: DUF4340 domain-containing protein [Nannocystis sp.]